MTYGRHALVDDDMRARDGEPIALHIALSVITCGAWAITGWPLCNAISLARRRRRDRPAAAGTERVAVL